VPRVDAFFRELDRAWSKRSEVRMRLSVIGSTALTLQTDYARGTKDGDVLETADMTPEVRDALLALAGPGAPLDVRHRMYLDVVRSGIPFLPLAPRWHPLAELNASLSLLHVEALDVIDVAVTKLKRLSSADLADIEAMVDRDRLPHDALVERFRSAVDRFAGDARAEDLPRYVKALHRVERDVFGVGPTPIELPDWV
jgi:hypothetical protein